MDRPEDIPQDVWRTAETAAKEATRDAMRDPLMPYYITVTPHIARAILKAREEAFEESRQIVIHYFDGSDDQEDIDDCAELSSAIRLHSQKGER